MKKLLACFSLFALLLAFASAASAAPMYTENFKHNGGGKSVNWVAEPGYWLDAETRASVSAGPVLGLYTVANEFKSVQSFNFVAGDTYTMNVNAFHTLAGKDRKITLAFMVEDAIIASVSKNVEYDSLPGGNNTDVSLSFVADQDYSNVKMAIFLGNTRVTFGFTSITLAGTPAAATPIPAAIFLLAPGLAGIAALRKRVS